VTATNLGLGILDVFAKARPEKPKLGKHGESENGRSAKG
jgi:hypothetical protein